MFSWASPALRQASASASRSPRYWQRRTCDEDHQASSVLLWARMALPNRVMAHCVQCRGLVHLLQRALPARQHARDGVVMIVFFAWWLHWILERKDRREFERDGGWRSVESYAADYRHNR